MLDFERREIEQARRKIVTDFKNGSIDEKEFAHLTDELDADENHLDAMDCASADDY